tara:strand:+ start:998 stop:1120 length:123 start_codon:yes stop_codon:yes gene_type:complete
MIDISKKSNDISRRIIIEIVKEIRVQAPPDIFDNKRLNDI